MPARAPPGRAPWAARARTWLPVRAATRPRPGRRSRRRSPGRSPGRARRRPRVVVSPVERLEDAFELAGGRPGALIDHADDRLVARGGDAHVHACRRRRELDGVLDEVREGALDLHRVDVDERDLPRRRRVRVRRRRRPLRGRGRRAPRRRPRARRCRLRGATDRADRRRAARGAPRRPKIVVRSSCRSESVRASVAFRSVPTAVVIPVSGERRSCETARSRAVFTRSLRRSVSASRASRSSRPRSSATASRADSAGRKRSRTSALGVAPRAGEIVPIRRPSTSSGLGGPRRSAAGLGQSISATRRRAPAAAAVSSQAAPPPAPPCEQMTRDVGEQRGLALALLRVGGASLPRAASSLTTTAVTE